MTHPDKPPAVLVVEDNRADADLVVDGLERAAPGIAVHVAGDGYEALEYLRDGCAELGERLPDLMLLDLNLPRLGGLETLTQLQADDRLRRIPVIVLTTSRSQKEINDSYARGAAAVLTKPMRLAEQREMVEALCTFWLRYARLPDGGV
jgi:CheY-like chemotaxis protein